MPVECLGTEKGLQSHENTVMKCHLRRRGEKLHGTYTNANTCYGTECYVILEVKYRSQGI